MPFAASVAKGLTGHCFLLAAVEAAGTPWHIAPDAALAERIACQRRVAAHHLHVARSDMTRLHGFLRRAEPCAVETAGNLLDQVGHAEAA